MLRPAALQSALEALVSPTCNSALLALPESGSLYASASSDACSSSPAPSIAPASAAVSGSSARSTSALMRGAPRAGAEELGIDERDRTLAAIGTQAWREDSGMGGKNGRAAAVAASTPGAPVLLDSELGATLIYPLRLPAPTVDAPSPIRRSSHEPPPPFLLILTSSAPPSQETADQEEDEGDPWADLMKRARAFEEHASPALASAFRA